MSIFSQEYGTAHYGAKEYGVGAFLPSIPFDSPGLGALLCVSARKRVGRHFSYGVGQYGFGGEEAYMIWKTLRQYMAYERNGGYSGSGRDFDTTWGSYSDVPNPVVEGFSTRKFFKAPKKIEQELDYLYSEQKYKECFDLIDKKWKTLPKGDKYELGCNKEGDQFGVWVTAPRKKEEGW
jgi:hypothetical protein